jgi:hypothetical protein
VVKCRVCLGNSKESAVSEVQNFGDGLAEQTGRTAGLRVPRQTIFSDKYKARQREKREEGTKQIVD